ncbi:flavin-containing monooxygenase [Mycobacterium spongiae]|nr:NAD(P)/FAD-dependent oxidoreductase [Mycobacterium spongiae]
MAEAIVCGAGAAGLAAAATLGAAGVQAVVLERSDRVGASWRSRYDGLRLNTPAWMSTLPGYRARHRKYGEYPSRDNWVRYLEDYTQYHRLDVRFGVDVQKLSATRRGWQVETDGEAFEAAHVIVATGHERNPYIPDWPGRESYDGKLIHSSAYRNPGPYRGRDVLVVGPNVTGSELANQLAKGGAERVRVACRTPPNVVARKFLGVNVNLPGLVLNRLPSRVGDEVGWLMQRILFGRLDQYGIPRSPMGVATTMVRRRQSPAYDDGFIDELRAGRIEIVAAVTGFDRSEVILAGGGRIRPDVVIAATGYRRGLQDLVGHLGVLDADGCPMVSGGRDHPRSPGLFFIGYRIDLSGQLRLMRIDAKAIAATISRGGGSGNS